MWAVIAFAVIFNTVISSALPKVEGGILIVHILGFFAILVPLVYLSPHQSKEAVFTVFYNGGGWPTQGLSFLIGLVATVFNFLGIVVRSTLLRLTLTEMQARMVPFMLAYYPSYCIILGTN